MQSLPIDSLLPEIVASLRRAPNLVVEAPPGAGKTTRVPPALLDAGVAGEGEVWVLEPRRLAARLSARRVAEERGEGLGETVGYQVRFDEVGGPRTRIRFLTEGVLTRRLLVFLPGAAEIRRAQSACEQLAARYDLMVVPLHGELPAEEQDRAVRPAERRKVILSTNVAETSVTIENVAAVVDSGVARVAAHSPWSGLPTLKVARVSQASAVQRAGRAGRTRAGRCLRLYTAQDFHARPAHETPEVRRLDLAETVL